VQLPSRETLPQESTSSSGQDAIEFAASVGLFLDPWQQHVLRRALGERADQKWSAFEVVLLCPRQNGKGAILEALELAGLFLFGERLIVHSAHKFDTAQEHFLRLRTLIDGSDDLRRQVAKVLTANGKESIVLRSGARLKFVARSRGAARGFSGDRIVFDEAFNLPAEVIGSMLPALSARPNPQVWYTSSAPHSDSQVLHALRRRALSDEPGRMYFAEWGCEPGVDPQDRDAWAVANPSLGIRISEEFVENELATMAGVGDEFARERLGVPSAEDGAHGVFPPGMWGALADSRSKVAGPVRVAVDVTPDMAWTSFAAAGPGADGRWHVELIDRQPGTGWAVERGVELSARYGPLVVDPKSPAAGLMLELERAGARLQQVSTADVIAACSTFERSVREGELVHLGQSPLDAAVASAAVRPLGDAWIWTRTRSTVDVSPLLAVTLAFWACGAREVPARKVELFV
jgi:phage terminase large subunit-like protein